MRSLLLLGLVAAATAVTPQKPTASAHLRATNSSVPAEAAHLTAEGKAALKELLTDLAAAMTVPANATKSLNSSKGFVPLTSPAETQAEFMPRCEAHVKNLVHTVDWHYTDVQLKGMLKNECWYAQEFPHTHQSGFQTHEACIAF